MRQLRAAERLIDHTVSDRSDELLIALRIAEILRRRDRERGTRDPELRRVSPQLTLYTSDARP